MMRALRYIGVVLLAMILQMAVNWILTFEVTWTYDMQWIWATAFWLTLGGPSLYLSALPVIYPGKLLPDKRIGGIVLAVVLTLWRIVYMCGIPRDWPNWLYGWMLLIQVLAIGSVIVASLGIITDPENASSDK